MSTTPRPAGKREWWGLAVLVLPTLLLALDMTVLHLAVPSLSADLKPTSAQLLWILDIYGFMIAGFLITMGTLGDRIGRRRLLLTGAVAFAIASVLAAFSTSAEMLIVTRALLGVAGATLMPSTLSLIRNMFEVDRERTVAITVWMTGFIVGSALGPVVGGAMLEFFWWGSVFLLGVPVMLLLLIAGPFLLPEFRDEHTAKLDFTSSLMSIGTFLGVIYGLKDMARNGVSLTALVAILMGLLVGYLFIRRQRRLIVPMFDMALFLNRSFSTSVIALMLTILAISGAWLMVFQYLQGVLGLSPFRAGLVMVPATLVQVCGSLFVPWLARRIKPGVLVSSGLLLAAVGCGLMAQANGMDTLGYLMVGTIVLGLGVMPMAILGTDLVVSSAPPAKAGAAAATSETASELGMALGIAVIGSIGAAVYRLRLSDTLPEDLPADLSMIALDTLGGALNIAEELGGAQGEAVLLAARDAFSLALHTNAWIGAAIVTGTAVFTALFLKHLPAQKPEEQETQEDQHLSLHDNLP